MIFPSPLDPEGARPPCCAEGPPARVPSPGEPLADVPSLDPRRGGDAGIPGTGWPPPPVPGMPSQGGKLRIVQETLDQALVRPSDRRVFAHSGCGGWVLFSLDGGHCLACGAGPLHVGEYEKPEAAA